MSKYIHVTKPSKSTIDIDARAPVKFTNRTFYGQFGKNYCVVLTLADCR